MNKLTQALLIATPLLALSFSAIAHDPKEHAKKPEKANCVALDKMKEDKKKVDLSDPIMIAMMKKCEKQAQDAMLDHHGEHSEAKEMDHSKMQHKEKTKSDDDNQ